MLKTSQELPDISITRGVYEVTEGLEVDRRYDLSSCDGHRRMWSTRSVGLIARGAWAGDRTAQSRDGYKAYRIESM